MSYKKNSTPNRLPLFTIVDGSLAPTNRREEASCWIVTDGKVGTEKPCRAIAAHLGFEDRSILRLKITPKMPWRYLPASLWPTSLLTAGLVSVEGNNPDIPHPEPLGWDDVLPTATAPWPKYIIAASRVAVKPSLALRRILSRQAKMLGCEAPTLIFWQNPRTAHHRFDHILAPTHDGLSGLNVTSVDLAPTLITPASITEAAKTQTGFLGDTLGSATTAAAPGKFLTVLVGGPNTYCVYTPQAARDLAACLFREVERWGADETSTGQRVVLITPSRRTPKGFLDVLLQALNEKANGDTVLGGNKHLPIILWDGTPPNPYEAFLGLAHRVVVTSDSISMVSDAVATQKPVTIVLMPSSGGNKRKKPTKFDAFFAALAKHPRVTLTNLDA